jgi:DNA-binding IclR family transcriptional regulator
MLKPATERQQIVLEAVRRLQASTGRAVLLREIAQEVGQPLPTIYPPVKEMIKAGLLTRGGDGQKKGVQVAEGDQRYRDGWQHALQHLEPVVATQLLEHHASAPLTAAIGQSFEDARNAVDGEA